MPQPLRHKGARSSGRTRGDAGATKPGGQVTAAQFEGLSKRLWDELVMLHDAWQMYSYLFGESEERVRMLNACAGWFFGATQRLLLRETILGISRLTDPLRIHGRDNLVLQRLLLDPGLAGAPETKAKLVSAIGKARKAARKVRAHRNRYIAHLDSAYAIEPAGNPLPGLSRRSISAAIQKLEDAYSISCHGSRAFDLSPLGSADALARILEKSERWRLIRQIKQTV